MQGHVKHVAASGETNVRKCAYARFGCGSQIPKEGNKRVVKRIFSTVFVASWRICFSSNLTII